MLCELATLSCPLLSLPEAAAGARDWTNGASTGTLLGLWRTEIGPLGRILVLRGFETADELSRERQRALLSTDPFNAGRVVSALDMASFAPFPFLPPIRTEDRGHVFEFRCYEMKPGGLVPTLEGWQAAIGPAHEYTAHLITNMYALDGVPRIVHLWGFESLEQRADLRARAYGAGIWPPKGGPEQIAEATSTIALPA